MNEKSLEIIKRVIERNGGKIIKKKQIMRNEILVDDNLWGEFYSVAIPGSGTLTAEWGNGKIEQADGEDIWLDRWNGLHPNPPQEETRHNKVHLSTEAENGIISFRLIGPWTYGWHSRAQVHIDISRCPSLQQLTCAKVQSLDVTQNTNLEGLEIWYADLQELNLDNNLRLETLKIFHCNNLKKLDLSNCPGLKYLELYCCQKLDTVILNDKSELEYVSYNYNTAIAGESEDRLLAAIEQNGGYVEKTYLGD